MARFYFEGGEKIPATLTGIVTGDYKNYCRAEDLNKIAEALNILDNTISSLTNPEFTFSTQLTQQPIDLTPYLKTDVFNTTIAKYLPSADTIAWVRQERYNWDLGNFHNELSGYALSSFVEEKDNALKNEISGWPVSTFENDVPYASISVVEEKDNELSSKISSWPVSTFENDPPYITANDLTKLQFDLTSLSGYIADHLCYYHVGAIFPYIGTVPPRGTLALNRTIGRIKEINSERLRNLKNI